YAKKVSSIVENLKKKIGQDDYKIYTFKELYNDFILLMRQKKVSSFVIIFFLLLIGGVGVVNTILISVYERIKEIGLLLAFGFTPKQIKILFLLEGIVIGVIGGSIGCILGAVVNLWLVYFGWNLESFYGEQVTGLKASQIGMPIWGVLYGEWNISAFIFCFCFAVIISTISAYFPAKYASKLQIRECLKFI
ncbi:MAG: FtsX-like permease family protein, partial [Endomicrobia bacterium]|nr:FtsX-like permease family protein [Endomicrobiia bacterium]